MSIVTIHFTDKFLDIIFNRCKKKRECTDKGFANVFLWENENFEKNEQKVSVL